MPRMTEKTGVVPEKPLKPEDDYKPGFIARAFGAITGPTLGVAAEDYSPTIFRDPKSDRMQSISVWSDIQRKMVPAFEYLRETEPIEMDIAKEAAHVAGKVIHKNIKRHNKLADPVSSGRDIIIQSTIGKVPMAGKFLGRAASKVAGVDVTEMGDATVDGAKRRQYEAARAEYDKLAVHFKRSEVKAAVAGRKYEPNFLQGIEHVRKVTDNFQDFTFDKGGLVDEREVDMSEAGENYRQAMWMGRDRAKQAYGETKSAGIGKAAVNYEKKDIPVA